MDKVATVVEVKQIRGGPRPYTTGRSLKFLPLTPNGSAGGGPTVAVGAVIVHAGANPMRFSVASVGDQLEVGDVIKTSPDTVAAIQFVLGGRVGVNAGSAVKIVSERAVTDYEHNYRAMFRGAWSHLSHQNDPVMIQTNGGVLGIKG